MRLTPTRRGGPSPPTILSKRTDHFRSDPPERSEFEGSGLLRAEPGVDAGLSEVFLDAQETVVLRDPLRAAEGARLDESGVRRDREVRDRRVLGLARTVRDDRDVPG